MTKWKLFVEGKETKDCMENVKAYSIVATRKIIYYTVKRYIAGIEKKENSNLQLIFYVLNNIYKLKFCLCYAI